MKKIATVSILLGLALSQNTFAQAKKKRVTKTTSTRSAGQAESETSKRRRGLEGQFAGGAYGTAGSGLGSIVFGEQKGMGQIFAATTNGLYGNQTSAISSGTSNCVDTNESAKATEIFIDTNKEVLKKEVAIGSGERLNTLSTLMGCSDASMLGQGLQKNFNHIFQNDSSVEVQQRIERTIRSNEKLAQSCQRVG